MSHPGISAGPLRPRRADAGGRLARARLPELGARLEKVWLPFPYERYLRSRYTAFDLMYELGLEEGILDELEGYVDRHP